MELPCVNCRGFVQGLCKTLPEMLRYVLSDTVRQHPYWKEFLPFKVRNYGTPPSPGYIFRVDGICGQDGWFQFSELDFSPPGLGQIALTLPSDRMREGMLNQIGEFVHSLGFKRLLIGTGSKTTVSSENSLLAQALQQNGLAAEAVNIDRLRVLHSDCVVFRLFYRSEISREPPDGSFMTSEPVLESKGIFALVHDPQMRSVMNNLLGTPQADYLRRTMPESYPLTSLQSNLPDWFLEMVTQKHFADWLVKATEVETDFSWGARGVALGCMVKGTTKRRRMFLFGIPPTTSKNFGLQPILQRFCQSQDFRWLWNGAADGTFPMVDAQRFGRTQDRTIVTAPASRAVTAKIGLYFLLNAKSGEIITPEFGLATLRQSPLCHGATDAMKVPFQIV